MLLRAGKYIPFVTILLSIRNWLPFLHDLAGSFQTLQSLHEIVHHYRPDRPRIHLPATTCMECMPPPDNQRQYRYDTTWSRSKQRGPSFSTDVIERFGHTRIRSTCLRLHSIPPFDDGNAKLVGVGDCRDILILSNILTSFCGP